MFQRKSEGSRVQSSPESPRLRASSWFVWFGLLLFLPGCTLMWAQTGQGSINGRVTDSTGAVVTKAAVQVINDDTKVVVVTETNDAGLYDVQSLNPGSYTVTVAGSGFQTGQVTSVTISAAQTTTIDVTLKAGKATETVVVTAEASLLTASTTDVSTTVEQHILQTMPLTERSSLEAVLLVPGVLGDPSVPGGVFSENVPTTTGPTVPGASLAVGGAPPGTASITLDGSDITMGSYARTGINLSAAMISEMTVITTGANAQYGRTSGGVIAQTSRAGTAQYHGSLMWRHTDPFFDAWPVDSTQPVDLHENFYAADVGGPVIIPHIYTGHGRNKTFFFAGFEPYRQRNLLGYRSAFPTDDDVAGRLHNNLALLNTTILSTQGYAAALAAPRTGGIFPNSTVNAQGIPNGKIGSSTTGNPEFTGPSGLDDISAQLAANPFASFVMSILPHPSNPGPDVIFDNAQGSFDQTSNNSSYIRAGINSSNPYSVRIDHQFDNNDQIWGRYSVTRITGARVFAVPASNPSDGVPTDNLMSRDLAFGYTRIFTSNLINNVHYSIIRMIDNRTPPVAALSTNFSAKYGLTPATLGKGFPALGALMGGSSPGGSAYYEDADTNFDVGDVLTWLKGNHSIQIGGDRRWTDSNQYDTSGEYGGKYSFSKNYTTSNGGSSGTGGVVLAAFDLGEINSFQSSPVEVPGYYRWNYGALFVQDAWRVLPKLTLNYGIRWEVETPRTEKYNNQAIMVESSMVNPASAEFCFSGSCGLGRGLWPTNWKGFEPRIGFAYAPTLKTTVRAAYGMYRVPLTGWENQPDPDFNVLSTTVGASTGGTVAGNIVDWITNPVPTSASSVSAYTALGGSRGPFLSSLGFNPDFVDQTDAVPYIQNWNLTLQFEPTPNTVIQATYAGNKGTHMIGSFSSYKNIPTVATLIANVQAGVNLGATASGVVNGVNGVTGETVLQALNPYPTFANVTIPEIYPRRGASSYNGMYVNAVHRYGNGLSITAYYAWSKSLDNVPDVNGGNGGNNSTNLPQDPHSAYDEWTVSAYDTPSILRGAYTYSLPFGQGMRFHTGSRILNQIIGNVTTSGIFTEQSGAPGFVTLGEPGYFTSFTPQGADPTPIGAASGITAPSCTTANYCSSSALPSGFSLRPNIVPGVPLINPKWKVNPYALKPQYGVSSPYLNNGTDNETQNAFSVPGSVGNPALGNASRSLPGARSPREFFFDMRAAKGFRIRERYMLNLTIQANDVFNHPVYLNSGHGAVYSAQTNVTAAAGTTFTTATSCGVAGTYSAPNSCLTDNSSAFANYNGQNAGNLSRVVRLGATFTF